MLGQLDGHALVEFSFTSQMTQDLPPAARLRLAHQAWDFNTRHGLTGELRFEDGCFRQVVEGPCELILPLASRILTDPRHGAIAVRAFRSITVRRFVGWKAVGFEPTSGLAIPAHNVSALPVNAGCRSDAHARSAQGARIG